MNSNRMIAAPVLPVLLALVLGATAAAASARSADESLVDPGGYALGQGLNLGNSGVTLGGYATASVSDLRAEPPQASLDSLSAMLWWDGPRRWRFLGEAELKSGLVLAEGRGLASGFELALERFYFDYAWSDAVQLRLGKFLTPIGRWNLLHASPLTWTTSRPLITESTFPTNATGAMIFGALPVLARGLEWSVYASSGEELAVADDIDPFEAAVGMRLAYALTSDLGLGASFASFEQRHTPDEHKQLYGLDFSWNLGRCEVSGELAQRQRDWGDDQAEEWGLYLQGVVPLGQRFYAIGRYESFAESGARDDLHLYLAGLAYRAGPALVFKAEYSTATENEVGAHAGFLASVAVLF